MTLTEQEARFNAAIHFAADRHAGQHRKGTDRPYILHPMEVACILNSCGADPDLLMAGLLHDTIEDTSAGPEELRALFGEEVTQLVCAHTEDKSLSWKERKTLAIEALRTAPPRLKLLVLADKLSNLRSMERDHLVVGEALWERFNAPKAQQRWYYTQMLSALKSLENDDRCRDAYREMTVLYRNLFEKI